MLSHRTLQLAALARGRRAGASVLTPKKARDPVGTVTRHRFTSPDGYDSDEDVGIGEALGNPSAVAVCTDGGVLVASHDMIFRAVIDDEQQTQLHLVTRVDYKVMSMKDDPRGRGFFVLSSGVGGRYEPYDALRLLDYEGRELCQRTRYFRHHYNGTRQSRFVTLTDIAPSSQNYVYFTCAAGIVELRPVYYTEPGFQGVPNSGRRGFIGYNFPMALGDVNQGGPGDTTLRPLADLQRPWRPYGLALAESEGTLIVSAINGEDFMYAVLVFGLASEQILSEHYYYSDHDPLSPNVAVGSYGIVYLACRWYVLRYTGGNNSMLEDTLAGGYDGSDDGDDASDIVGITDGCGASAGFESIRSLALDEKRGLLWVADEDCLRTVAVRSLSEQRAETLYSIVRLFVLYQRRRARLEYVAGSALLDRMSRLPVCLVHHVLCFARLWKQNAFEHELVTNMMGKCAPYD